MIGTNYSMGTDYGQSQPVEDSYLGAPVYAQTSGAITAGTQGTGSSDLGNSASGVSVNQNAAAPKTDVSQMPISDYSQVAPWLQNMQNQNQYGAATGWLGQGINPQVGANIVQDYNKLGSQYGYDAAKSPYFQTDAFKNDPRFARTAVTNPFQTFDWNYAGFGSPLNGGPQTGYSFYNPGQGFNPITGTWAQGGEVYAPPKVANGRDNYWGRADRSNLQSQVNPYLTGGMSVDSLYNQRGSFSKDSYYRDLMAQQGLNAPMSAGGFY